MAAPTYSTDLTTLTESETSTGLVEPTATNWTALSTVTSAETDFFIQRTACTSAIAKTGVQGLLYNNGAGITIPTDGAVLCWAFFWASGLLDTETNGGIRQVIGSGTAAFYWVSHGGSDTWTYGGWLCLAMADPSAITVNTVGSPTSTRQYFGWVANTLSSPNRGNAYGIDAIRYGRCTLQIVGGDLANGYGTFARAAEFNDKNNTTADSQFTLLNSGYHRLGLFQFSDGTYKWQGQFLLGTASTAVDFRDSNRTIFVLNTKHVTANFNLFEVRNASSRVDWTGISIQALGTKSKGRFLVTDNADINKESCTFTDMDTFVYQSNSTINNSIYRRCGLVTTGGAVFTNCIFDNPTGTVGASTANLSSFVNCTFNSDGTGHAVDLGTISSTTSMDWNIKLTGYAASNGSTGNEALKVNVASGQTLTINVASGASTPSYYNTGTGTVTIVSGSVSATLTVTNVSGTAISGAQVLVKAAAGGNLPVNATVTISNSGTTATVTHTGHAMATGDKVLIRFISDTGKVAANEGVFSITKINDNSYSYTMGSSPGTSPTGTIKATYVLLSGTTDVNGQITMSRSFAANQPVTGWARKSSSAPYYKQGAVNGTVTTGSGASLSAVLVADE
jgi:hypothetical protein